jgi:UDP-3-O-[3-hydroxymyristoyl] glucosamine N-acyltransferase
VRLAALAQVLGTGVPAQWESFEVTRLSSPQDADEHSLVFLSDQSYRVAVEKSAARVVIAQPGIALEGKVVLAVKDPYLGFAQAGRLFEDTTPPFEHSLHAVIDPSARLGANVVVGPLSVVGRNVAIGENSILAAGCIIEKEVSIGRDCLIESGAVIRRGCKLGDRVIIQSNAVIGSEGFSNAKNGDAWERIPSFGNVVIEDDAWIGACTCIDRGALGPTLIGRGARIDNLVDIAHNVSIGEHTAIVAQTGIAGSTKIGKRVTLAGQTGFVGHIEVGDDVFVGAKAGVSKSIPPGTKVTGYPAREFMKMRRIDAASNQLPELLKEVKELRKKIQELETRTPPTEKETH